MGKGNKRLTQEGTVAEKQGKWKGATKYSNQKPKNANKRCRTKLLIEALPLTSNEKAAENASKHGGTRSGVVETVRSTTGRAQALHGRNHGEAQPSTSEAAAAGHEAYRVLKPKRNKNRPGGEGSAWGEGTSGSAA